MSSEYNKMEYLFVENYGKWLSLTIKKKKDTVVKKMISTQHQTIVGRIGQQIKKERKT